MKRLRIIGLLLLALFALGAFAASSASAVEGVLPLKMKHFNILGSGKQVFESAGGSTILCLELKGSGEFTSDHHGTAKLDFLKCTFAGFLFFSLGEKEPKEENETLILMPVLFLICLLNSATLLFGIFLELTEPVHTHVPALFSLITLMGSVIGDILAKAGENLKLILVHFKGEKGKQEFSECKDEAGGVKKAQLKSKTNAEAELNLSLTTEKVLFQFLEAQELMDK